MRRTTNNGIQSCTKCRWFVDYQMEDRASDEVDALFSAGLQDARHQLHRFPGLKLLHVCIGGSAYQSRMRMAGADRAAFRLMMAFRLHTARPACRTFGRSRA